MTEQQTTHEQLVRLALSVAFPDLVDTETSEIIEPFLSQVPVWVERAAAQGPATVQFEAIGGYSASYNVAAAGSALDSWLTPIEKLALAPYSRSRVGSAVLSIGGAGEDG